jgi:hypothetical protein
VSKQPVHEAWRCYDRECGCHKVRGACPECGRQLANEFDEGIHNTGACGCTLSRSLCWFRWNGHKCLPYSIYDNQPKSDDPNDRRGWPDVVRDKSATPKPNTKEEAK